MWLHLGGSYWQRASFDAVVVLLGILGLIGFTAPLFLTLIIMERVTIRSFAMLLFCVPALTFIASASIGYATFFPSDLIAAALAIFGAVFHERRTGASTVLSRG